MIHEPGYTQAHLVEDVEWMVQHKEHPIRVHERVGADPAKAALTQMLYRAGRPDLASYVARASKK